MSQSSSYFYPGTDVLINKADIRNHEDLQIFERERTSLRAMEMRFQPIQGDFDFEHFKSIHQTLFQDVYPFAGQVRDVNIGKSGFWFCEYTLIDRHANIIFNELKQDSFLRNLSIDRFAERAAYYFSEINFIHPFREGNGRSTREFFHQLAQKAGYELDWSNVPKEKFMEAVIETNEPSELGKLEKVIKHCLYPIAEIQEAQWIVPQTSMRLIEVLKLADGLPETSSLTPDLLNQSVDQFQIVTDKQGQRVRFLLKDATAIQDLSLKEHPYLSRDRRNQMLDQAAVTNQPTEQRSIDLER